MSKKYLILWSLCLFFCACSQQFIQMAQEVSSIDVDESFGISSDIENLIEPYKAELGDSMNTFLCFNDKALIKARPESALGNLVADLTLELGHEFYHPEDGQKIDFCLLNTGGLRSSLPEGEILTANVFELMPFENELVVVTLSAGAIQDLLNYLKERGGDPIAGMRVAFIGEHTRAFINNQDIDLSKEYKVITTDYLASGGDKMTFFEKESRKDINYIGLKMRDAIHLYFERLGKANKSINARIDGRLKIE